MTSVACPGRRRSCSLQSFNNDARRMLTLWGRRNSTNVRKVLWCLEELGLPYRRLDAGGAYGVVDDAAYRELNPNGRIPTLQDDGFVLWESNAIVRYLVSMHAHGTPWHPADPRARAGADRWMDWTTATLAGPFRDLFWGVLRTPPEHRDPAAILRARDACGVILRVADQALSRSAWLSGPELGMGDIPLGSFAYAWFGMPIERPDLPHLRGWYERLAERPAYRRAVMTELT